MKAPVLPDRAGIDALKAIISKRSPKQRFEMSSFTSEFCGPQGNCGTAYCIAGYASVLQGQKAELLYIDRHVADLTNVLDPDQSRRNDRRFAEAIYDMWNGVGIRLYRFDDLPHAQRKRAALELLETFATTGKVDWQAVTPESVHERL